MQIPNILFIRSIHALLTRDIIPERGLLVNHFFIFSAKLFAAFFRPEKCAVTPCKFLISSLDSAPEREYSYIIKQAGFGADLLRRSLRQVCTALNTKEKRAFE